MALSSHSLSLFQGPVLGPFPLIPSLPARVCEDPSQVPSAAAPCRAPRQSARGGPFLHHSGSCLRPDPHSDRNLSSVPQTQHLCHACLSFLPQNISPSWTQGCPAGSCGYAAPLPQPGPLSPPCTWTPEREEMSLVVRGLLPEGPRAQFQRVPIANKHTLSGDSPSGRPALTASGSSPLSPRCVPSGSAPPPGRLRPICGSGAREAGAQAVPLCRARTPGSPHVREPKGSWVHTAAAAADQEDRVAGGTSWSLAAAPEIMQEWDSRSTLSPGAGDPEPPTAGAGGGDGTGR